MTTDRLNGTTIEAAVADERTPIVNEARSSSYRATDGSGEPQASGTRRQPEDSAQPRQRRKRDANSASADESEQEPQAGGQSSQHDGWLRRIMDKYGAVELENKGSVARDHLALAIIPAMSQGRICTIQFYLTFAYSTPERTFLAWLRTSLSFAGIGIAVTQLFRLNTTITDHDGQQPAPDAPANRLRRVGKPLGATFLAISVIVLLIGWRRYFESQFYIIKGKFPASRGSIFLTTFAAFALVVATFVIVLVVDPSLFQAK